LESMSTKALQDIVSEALPGKTLSSISNLPGDIESPWRVQDSENIKWAIYLVNSKHWPKTVEHAIRTLNRLSIAKPCLLLPRNDSVEIVAEQFLKLHVPIIVRVGGRGCLLEPPEIKKPRQSRTRFPSRISPQIIQECSQSKTFGGPLTELLKGTWQKYHRQSSSWTDDKEQQVLGDFFTRFVVLNGLSITKNSAQIVLRKLEQSGFGGRRDHFFHSFQIFFLGLWVLAKASQYVKIWNQISRQNWALSPEFVWFLVAMWHDVGYGFHFLEKLEGDLLGIEPVSTRQELRSSYLESPAVQDGLREISSLQEHLLKKRPETAWSPPSAKGSPTKLERLLRVAFEEDLLDGHGAASALRLYTDMRSFIDKCAVQTKRNVLWQSALIASASIPYHDWHFRSHVRDCCGRCKLPAPTMPFSALLTFIDSLQEDSRDFQRSGVSSHFLWELSVENGVILPDIDSAALDAKTLIWKMIEARDVKMTLEMANNSLQFEYPKWILGIQR